MGTDMGIKALEVTGEKDLVKKFRDNLGKSLCPFCGSADKKTRDEISAREMKITGLCQKCQDKFEAMEDL